MSEEKNFYQQLRTKFLGHVHLQRIESSTGSGTPDVNYCINGSEGWLELKAWKRVRMTGSFVVPKLRPEQCAWMYKRSQAGGRVYLLCRVNQDVILFNGSYAPNLIDTQSKITYEDVKDKCLLYLPHPVKWDVLQFVITS